jgi:hypothetical protein
MASAVSRSHLLAKLKRAREKERKASDAVYDITLVLLQQSVAQPEAGKKSKSKKAKAAAAAKPDAVEPEPWVCAGNVLSGDACVGGKGSDVRAADTRHEKKSHPTCRACKRAIGKTRSELKKKEEGPTASAVEPQEDEAVIEPEAE